jgi:hypothetical protein
VLLRVVPHWRGGPPARAERRAARSVLAKGKVPAITPPAWQIRCGRLWSTRPTRSEGCAPRDGAGPFLNTKIVQPHTRTGWYWAKVHF